jgi:two-component system torCAD operon response regulator TorR
MRFGPHNRNDVVAKLDLITSHLRVLIVDEDQEAREELAAYLAENGILVHQASSWDHMPVETSDVAFDAVLTEIADSSQASLLGCIEACNKSGAIPIIVSRLTDWESKVAALEQGAADYICKPVCLRELLLRIVVALKYKRRHIELPDHVVAGAVYQFAGYKFHSGRQELVKPDGSSQSLTAAQAKVLRTFLDHTGQILSRADIIGSGLSEAADLSGRATDSHIRRLRQKMQIEGKAHVISTFYGGGYMLDAAVTIL